MKIKKYTPAIIIVLGVIAILALIIFKEKQTTELEKGNLFFYGDTCPHCKNVEEYMAANGTRDKISFQELEVYNNRANAQLLGQVAQKCGLDSQTVGIPFFYDGSQCLMGDQEIINYFQSL